MEMENVMTMVERVAKAIEDNIAAALPEGVTVDYRYAAVAAIEELREPTEAMVGATGGGECNKWARGAWALMIDAALEGVSIDYRYAAAAVIEEMRTPTEAMPAPKAKTLTWGEPQKPNEDIRYDHILSDEFGYSIEWKSWKEYDGRVLYRDGEYVAVFHTAEDAKEAAQADMQARVNQLLGIDAALKEHEKEKK